MKANLATIATYRSLLASGEHIEDRTDVEHRYRLLLLAEGLEEDAVELEIQTLSDVASGRLP